MYRGGQRCVTSAFHHSDGTPRHQAEVTVVTRPPHPRWTDWAEAVRPAPADLAELIQLVEHLRDELRQGIRQPESADLARHLAEHAERLGYPKAASALRRCTSACEAGLQGAATSNAAAALRSLRSAVAPS